MENELEILEPQHSFWQVTVEVLTEDENGKVKKQKEVHLVDDACVTGVEKKVSEAMKGTLDEWKIVQITQSKVIMVY